MPGQPAFLEFRSDGSFSWGKGIGGTYTMLGFSKVRLALVQDGRPVGHLDHNFTIDGRQLDAHGAGRRRHHLSARAVVSRLRDRSRARDAD